MNAPLLKMTNITKAFGATRALRGVSLSVQPGEAMALIGENGAGKSTLMKVLSGALRPDDGIMELNGRSYSPRGPQDARRDGVAMIYQELNLAPDLSVEDNIMLGQESRRWGLLNRSVQRRRVREALQRLGHPDLHPETIVRSLSVGAQQLVEIARALVLDARLIVFDEPTSSLAQRDVRHLFNVIRRLKQAGIGVIYISHFLEEIREICDRYTVLRDGETVGTGELLGTNERQIVNLMVGRSVAELFPTVPHDVGETLLTVHGLSGTRLPKDLSLEVRRGEILGIAGLIGAGRTETLRTLFGLDPTLSGTVELRTQNVRGGIRRRIVLGLGFVSEDRKGEGLAQARSLADNITYSRLERYSSLGWLRLGERRRVVTQLLQQMQVKASSSEQEVQSLSGGNQQKVAIARVLHQDADVLLLDEPTRGIDVGTKSEIYRLMGTLAAQGKAIIFVSSYLPELMAVSDRLAVMSRGRLREIRATRDWTEEEVMARAVKTEEDEEPIAGTERLEERANRTK